MEKRCELYLRLCADALSDPAELERIVRATGPAALLLTDLDDVPRDAIRQIVEAARRQNLAILLEDHVDLAKACDADGVHIKADSGGLSEARRLLGDTKSIGASCGLSRHEAMEIAEAGADYVAFGQIMGRGPRDDDALAEMIRWWDELFEVPCVAWLSEDATKEDASRLVRAGADYLAVALDGETAFDMGRIRDLAALASDPVVSA